MVHGRRSGFEKDEPNDWHDGGNVVEKMSDTTWRESADDSTSIADDSTSIQEENSAQYGRTWRTSMKNVNVTLVNEVGNVQDATK